MKLKKLNKIKETVSLLVSEIEVKWLVKGTLMQI